MRYFANDLNNQLRIVTVLHNDVIVSIFCLFISVWLLFFTIFTTESDKFQVTAGEIGLNEAFGDDNHERSMLDYDDTPADYCDVELCRFEGEASPRKHVACVEDDVR